MAADPQAGCWLLPSRKRPANLVRFFEALRATNTSTPGIVLINADEFDDPDLAVAYDALPIPCGWGIIKTSADSQGDKLREISCEYNDLDWMGLIGDDQIPLTEQWDLKLIERLKGWNLVSCDDEGWQSKERGGRIAGTMLWSGDLYRAAGYLFPPGIHHVYVDDIWEEIGRETGCWRFTEDANLDVTIAHHHYTRGMAEKDETYSRAYDQFAQSDFPVWNNWQVSEKPHTCARIRELMKGYSAC